jgi:pimeloyl-ACP methyl ester carboxylesterase
MQTHTVPISAGVELAVDSWSPEANGYPAIGVAPGAPAPFLLVHGLASNARLWDGVGARLVAAGHAVAAVDLRGHGRSSKPDGPYDVAAVADDLATLIATLGLDRPIVAGQSWGGNVVLELAARHPQATRAIVCVDGGWLEPSRAFASWDACRQALSPPRLVGRPLAEIEAHIRSAHPDWPEAGIRGTLANFEVRTDGTVAPWLTYEHHVAVLRGLWDHHPSERYPLVPVPVLLLPVETGGAARDERKRDEIAAARAALRYASVRWFMGDHDIHAQHPDDVADAMSEFVRGLARPATGR